MEKQPVPAPYAFFKQLVAADDTLRKESDAMETTLTDEQQMSLFSSQQAFTIAIDLWDGMSKGIGTYNGLLDVYRRFYQIMENKSTSDDPYSGNPEAYKEILQMLEDTGIDFNKKV
jgi:hypothetical protein